MGARVPDLRGLFLRGHGSQSLSQNNGSTIGVTSTLHRSEQLGQIQGDATREISGDVNADGGYTLGTGPFFSLGWSTARPHGQYTGSYQTKFDSSRIVPTANEIRPVNMAVRYFIRALK